jgi:hypothetical protein
MTVKTDFCQECGRLTLTGWNGCAGKQLCSSCASKYLGVEPEKVQMELERLERGQEVTTIE